MLECGVLSFPQCLSPDSSNWLVPVPGLPRQREGVHRHSGSHGEHSERLLADGVAGGGARHRHDHQTEGEERGKLTWREVRQVDVDGVKFYMRPETVRNSETEYKK